MTRSLTSQARRMCGVLAELLRRYQFRDRDQVCCHGLSISQCYALELLAESGPRTMGALAAEICLKISTATRVVDHLVAGGLVERLDDPNDRRVCRVQITAAGHALVRRVQAELVAEYESVLSAVPAESREAVIVALSHLLSAFKQRQCSMTKRGSNTELAGEERRRKAGGREQSRRHG